MAAKWKAPEGFVVTKHPGYQMNTKGFRAAKGDDPMPDDGLLVAHFKDSKPFTSDNSPNVELLPIADGWVPPVYTLHTEEEAPNVEN